jgi:hypothetical protein
MQEFWPTATKGAVKERGFQDAVHYIQFPFGPNTIATYSFFSHISVSNYLNGFWENRVFERIFVIYKEVDGDSLNRRAREEIDTSNQLLGS